MIIPHNIIPQLNCISIHKNQIMICVKKLFSLTDNKFYFDETTILSQNKIIDIENKDYTDKRIALYNKDFNNNEYITIKGFKIDPDVELIIPYYECTSFLCSKCKKLHNGKSNKCCSLSSSPILIKQYKIKKIVFPDKNSIEEELAKAKKDFIDLHFPDFLDRIMI
jgi:hypothetical protein